MDFTLDAIDTTTNAEKGVRMPLKTLDGNEIKNNKKQPVGLILYGTDSERYRSITRKITRDRMARNAARNEDDVNSDAELDQQRDESLLMMVQMTSGWFGVIDSKGDDIPFTVANLRAFYEKYPVAREQADRFIADRTRFTKA